MLTPVPAAGSAHFSAFWRSAGLPSWPLRVSSGHRFLPRRFAMHKAFVSFGTSILLLSAFALGGDWPQYRGANHDGSSGETIQKVWSADGPRVVWKVPMGVGFSSISVAGGRAYCNAERDDK